MIVNSLAFKMSRHYHRRMFCCRLSWAEKMCYLTELTGNRFVAMEMTTTYVNPLYLANTLVVKPVNASSSILCDLKWEDMSIMYNICGSFTLSFTLEWSYSTSAVASCLVRLYCRLSLRSRISALLLSVLCYQPNHRNRTRVVIKWKYPLIQWILSPLP